MEAAIQHFRETKDMYGRQFCVNTVDNKGSEGNLGNNFTKLHKELKDPEIDYTWFDFHKECKKMKWENLGKLVDIVKEKFDSYGNFIAEIQTGFDNRTEFNNPNNCRILQR